MDKEFTASNFIPEKLLDIICILERDEKHHSYKIIRNKNNFSLIVKFGAKNAETTPLKNNASAKRTGHYQDKKQVSSEDKLCKSKRKRGKKKSSPCASGKSASQHTDRNRDSSNVGQAEQPKLKKKTPAQVQHTKTFLFNPGENIFSVYGDTGYPHNGRADKDSYPHDRHNQWQYIMLS